MNHIDNYKINKMLMNALYQKKDFHGALQEALKILKNNSSDIETISFTGNVFKELNDIPSAFYYFKFAAELDKSYEMKYENLYSLLIEIDLDKYFSNLQKYFNISEGFELLLSNKKYLGNHNLTNLVIKTAKYLLKTNLFIKIKSKLVDDKSIINSNDLDQLTDLKLLNLCIDECVVCDIHFEKFLKILRKSILFNRQKVKNKVEILKLTTNLAINSYLNEYIWSVTIDEKKEIEKLKGNLDNSFKLDCTIDDLEYICLGMYLKLSNFNFYNSIKFSNITEKFKTITITNNFEEKKLKSSIKTISNLNNQTTKKVKGQYERFPYPQWIYTDTNLQITDIVNFIKSFNLDYNNKIFDKSKIHNILIAGCGTGKEIVDRARMISNVNITAIDISKSSLAYALRKCNEYQINNAELFQCDILNIDKLNKNFDMILCNGVLHHMKEPIRGLEKLYNSLNKNGLMKISLYSKLGRSTISNFQEQAKKNYLLNNIENLRIFRDKIIDDYSKLNNFIYWSDFYKTSEFKDLICHEMEHQFTISKIDKMLSKLGLKFCGFVNVANVVDNFINHYQSSDFMYDLNKWNEFENKFKNSFAYMYQFWIEKV